MKYCIICNKTSTYGLLDEQTPKYCSECSKSQIGKMVNYKHGYCEKVINENGKKLSERLCGKNANFNYVNATVKKGIRCLDHKEINMLCINGHLCKVCKIMQASFILPGTTNKTPTHCSICLENSNVKEKIDITHKKCKECNDNNATYSLKEINIKEYCKGCIDKLNLDGIDVHHKRCVTCNKRTALYNVKDKSALYCGDCKTNDMKYINKVTCIKCNDKRPIFNYPNMKGGKYCKECSEEGMINVVNRMCEKCTIKRPSFNISGESKPIYCGDCKTNDMVNVYHDICIEEECDDYAWYNYNGEEIPIYCKNHIKEGMINISGSICIYQDCDIIASFNYENETKRLYCSKHLLEGMIDLNHKKCITCNKKRAIYNDYGKTNGLYCIDHKTYTMINVEHKLCKTYLCETRAIKHYEDYCMRCFIYTYPDKPLSRNYKVKENEVVKYIMEKFPDFTWKSDKVIQDGCSLKRPDLLLDLGYLVINIEIDENQHRNYEEICENKRLMIISQDIQHRNLILIRFNPDSYTKNGKVNQSCWTKNNNGTCTIKKPYEKIWDKRLKILEDTIKYWTNSTNISDKMINVIHLFYDEM